MKKKYNNLYDSIWLTIGVIIFLSLYCITIYFGVIRARDVINAVVVFIASSIVFLGFAIICFGFIIWDGYSYWKVDENRILYKRFLRKKVIIPLSAEFKVEKKPKSALILSYCQTDAYFIEYNNQKAIIYINKKNEEDLELLFGKYIV